ncbi:MAG: neuraminidase-like domain-containing protein, partial [Salinivirgaceae bacterium]|nr:neuraminidase-like domain-containing protein [Salinivirgaceae bacterium]
NEINTDTIESAYLNYLSKLEKVSNLEYCQLYNEVVNSYSVLHVIGRTRFEPREYFYRKFVNESYWTAWEKVEVEINSEHLAPVVIKDRLVLFWLEFTDEAQEPTDDDLQKTLVSSGDSQQPVPKRATKLLKIKLCWSEYRDKKWSLKKTADQPIEVKDASSNDKFNYQLVFKGDNIHVIYKNNSGYTYWVECYNHIAVSKFSTFISSGIRIPEGLALYGQKLVTNTEKDIVSLPIPTENGTLVIQQIADTPDGTTLIFPHQYSDIKNQSSFIVENKFDSLVLVPIIQPEKISHSTNIAAQKAAMLEQAGNTSLEQVAQIQPDFFTDEHQDLSIINDTPDSESVVYSVKDTTSNSQDYEAYKSKINAYLGYHPYMGLLRTNLERYGVEGMLDPLTINTDTSSTGFVSLLPRQENWEYLEMFDLNSEVVLNLLKDTAHTEKDLKYIAKAFEFNTRSTYGIYNWELFFHIPYLMATHFTIQGDYDQALKWVHYIFDPRISEGEAPARYWKFKPFADYHKTTSIEDMMYELSLDGSSVDSNEMNDQIEIWSNDPFKPHNIAQMRVSAYMKAVVMKYLDILVARGDELFRTDTMESINEALMYYIIGAQILGKKPEVLETSILAPKTYTEFQSDGMGNCIESFEEPILKPENAAYLEKFVESNEVEIASKPFTKDKDQKNMVMDIYGAMQQTETVYRLYFGIPKNDKFFGYWDLVADRLFKIRNSMNIDGVKRTLDLFAPPIDPGLLAKAAASGVSISDALSVGSGNTTQYRFTTLLQLAVDICNEVKSLGGALLSAWEKHDSEYFSQLKASQEIVISNMISDIKLKNIDEAQINIEQMELTQELTTFRMNHYKNLERRSKKEVQQLAFMDASQALQLYSQAVQVIAGTTVLTIPEVKAGASGFGGSPYFVVQFGGREINVATQSYATAINMLASISSHLGTRSGIVGGYERREEEWDFQAAMAEKELLGIEKQKLAADIRKAVAEFDYNVHLKQLEQSKDNLAVLQTKFSNKELYLWMANELSSLYRLAYQTAYQMAKKAEAAYVFELCPETTKSFINSDNFDANYKGLLAGERLFQQLKKMEASYLENNTRKFELTKHISLAMLDPKQILDLRSTGNCEINIPEILFDMDHPGHYKRRIKSVALTIPCVSGPYTSISASLMLGNNRIRVDKLGNYAPIANDSRFIYDIGKNTTIATSSSINDSGMFELNFNDARYLPFEGAGAISEWILTLPNKVRQFDYNTITDVILHIQYTAEEAGIKSQVEDYVVATLNAIAENNVLGAMFSLKHQFPEAWAAISAGNVTIEITKSAFPYFIQQRTISISGVTKNEVAGTTITPTAITGVTGQLPKSIEVPLTDTSVLDDIIVLVNYTVS